MDTGSAFIVQKTLRKAWAEKPCPHPRLEQIVDLGKGPTGWFCLVCGRDVDVAVKTKEGTAHLYDPADEAE